MLFIYFVSYIKAFCLYSKQKFNQNKSASFLDLKPVFFLAISLAEIHLFLLKFIINGTKKKNIAYF